MSPKARGLVRKIYPHAYLFEASKHALRQGKNNEKGSFYNFLASMLFVTFALEAYLNYVGKQKLSTWDEIERKLSPKEKLELLCEITSYAPNFGQKPYQTFNDMFKFRNLVVHAKPEEMQIDEIELHPDGSPKKLPKSKWLEICNLNTAESYLRDAESIVKDLDKTFNISIGTLITETTWFWEDDSDNENE